MKKVWIADHKATKSPPDISAYTHIRGYRACRPKNIGDYLRDGIILPNHNLMVERAASVFEMEASSIRLLEADRNLSPSKEIYFCTCRHELVKESGHYLCWGSEYFAGLAALLDKGEFGPNHSKLEAIGIPTLFVCDVPIELIPKHCLDGIIECFNPGSRYCSFWIYEALPANCIVEHEHPKRIFNSVQWRTYVNTNLQCPYCSNENTLSR